MKKINNLFFKINLFLLLFSNYVYAEDISANINISIKNFFLFIFAIILVILILIIGYTMDEKEIESKKINIEKINEVKIENNLSMDNKEVKRNFEETTNVKKVNQKSTNVIQNKFDSTMVFDTKELNEKND